MDTLNLQARKIEGTKNMSTTDTKVKEEFKDDVVMPYRGRDQRMPDTEETGDESPNDQTETGPKEEDTSFISVAKDDKETTKSKEVQDPSSQDEGWENRYNNLRTFSDRKITEQVEEIQRLKLEGKIPQNIPLPSTKEQVKEWMEKYPDTANVIETMIIDRTQEVNKPLEERLDQVEVRERRVNKREAEVEILQKHPDYKQLQANNHFKDWILTQPDAIVGCLINSSSFDAFGAIRAIDLYKSDLLQNVDRENQEVQKLPREPSAADLVPTTKRTEVRSPTNKRVWTTSEIGKLKSHQYEKFEQEIDLARSEGRVVQG